MIISYTTYMVLVGIIAAIAIIPTLISKIKKKGNKGFGSYSFILLVILLPINWYTPTILDVTDCGNYTKNILIFPKDGYSMGKYNYIVNNSKSALALDYIPYGNVKDEDIPESVLIRTGKNHQANIVKIDYLFEDIPSSIKLKSKGAVRTALYCFDGDEEELYDDESTE